MTESAYIHIPFCKSKCKYCSFISTTQTESIKDYVAALVREIRHYYGQSPLKTIYFGGGTPSLLKIDSVEKILQNFNFSDDTEITFEINPDDTTKEYLEGLKNLGINRLSFGSQTFDDEILGLIGRRHSSADILKSVKTAKDAGFENISIDLIYGLPKQTEDLLRKDLEIIKNLGIQHVSTYGLKIEPPSYFSSHLPQNLPDDDKQADMYLMINEFLNNIGFKRYEISNFAVDGFESRHNLNYWNNAEYYGFGAAAHGYKDGVRYFNTSDIEGYMRIPTEHKEEHILSAKEKLEEEVFLGFRREKGLNVEEINKKFDIDFDEKYRNILEKFSPEYIIPTENGYKLTLNGVLLSNNILSEFID